MRFWLALLPAYLRLLIPPTPRTQVTKSSSARFSAATMAALAVSSRSTLPTPFALDTYRLPMHRLLWCQVFFLDLRGCQAVLQWL